MDAETDLLLDRLIERHGTLFSEDLGIDLGRNEPSQLFRWLCAALLMSARISHLAAMDAARALSDAGWTTADRMADSDRTDRVRVLNRSGYARYDESTARMLGSTARRLRDDYSGDLRQLRSAADEDPAEERELLKEFKGIGDVGADIFFREMQGTWAEHFPFLDAVAQDAAGRLRLPAEAGALAERVGRERFPRLAAALVRVGLADIGRDELLAEAEASAP